MGRRPSGKLSLAADGQKFIQMRRYTVSSLYTLLVKFGGKKKKWKRELLTCLAIMDGMPVNLQS